MKLTRLVVTPLFALVLMGTPGITQGYRPQGPLPQQWPAYGKGWAVAPQGYRDIQRQGFRDGIDGAQKDVQNRRRPNVNNRDEYRNPAVQPSLRQDYRVGFKRGYTVAMQHMASGGTRPY